MKKIGLFFLGTLFLMSCNSLHHAESHKENHAHWSYTGEENPDNWSHISEKYKACEGSIQSPINIDVSKVKAAKKTHTLNVNYNTSKVNIVNNGHTEQFNIGAGNDLTFDGKTYQLKQFHMHSLSEHTIDGQHSPLEVHFVNKAEDNTYAVISVLFEKGDASPFFQHFLNNLPKKEGEYTEENSFDIHEMLPSTEHFYHYNGSFTTPPCTEVVEWIILTEKLTASKAQLDKLHHLLHDNYRPVQPVNDRTIDAQ